MGALGGCDVDRSGRNHHLYRDHLALDHDDGPGLGYHCHLHRAHAGLRYHRGGCLCAVADCLCCVVDPRGLVTCLCAYHFHHRFLCDPYSCHLTGPPRDCHDRAHGRNRFQAGEFSPYSSSYSSKQVGWPPFLGRQAYAEQARAWAGRRDQNGLGGQRSAQTVCDRLYYVCAGHPWRYFLNCGHLLEHFSARPVEMVWSHDRCVYWRLHGECLFDFCHHVFCRYIYLDRERCPPMLIVHAQMPPSSCIRYSVHATISLSAIQSLQGSPLATRDEWDRALPDDLVAEAGDCASVAGPCVLSMGMRTYQRNVRAYGYAWRGNACVVTDVITHKRATRKTLPYSRGKQ